ncbi:MAG: alkaline phosphatase family protein, partial [Acidobacteriota bacterium]
PPNAGEISGGRVYPVQVDDNRVQAHLIGPKNTFRKEKPAATVDFTVWLDPVESVAKLEVQEHELLLRQGEWSDWVQVEFELIPYVYSTTGICRFYLKQVRPSFQLYVTPINIDPSNPALPLSTPEDYAEELWEEAGLFYTQGIAEDTKALSEGIFDVGEFLAQTRLVLDDQRRIFEREFARFDSGLFFFYFSSLDQNAHMLWRFLDKEHPSYDPELAARYSDVLAGLYQEMDEVLGQVLARMDDDTTLIIMSDHGFASFRRSFNLNTWLLENGYLVLEDESLRDETEFLLNVDWSRTRAYALGLNALYLNLRSRERQGIVEPGEEAERLMAEISGKLLAVTDPETGTPVITRVDRAQDVYAGPYTAEAPDLLVGYNRGYRAGWDSILGKFPRKVLEDNTRAWSGDHCMDFALVPGVLLSNKQIRVPDPALTDLSPTILAEFGIDKPAIMVGRPLLPRAAVHASN